MSKITVSIEHVDPKHPNPQSMAQTIGLLAQLVDLPSGGLKLTIQCESEDMKSYADDLRAVLSRRPVGIRVFIDKQDKEEVERSTMASVTPMDKGGWGDPSALFPGQEKTSGEKALDWLVAREERRS